jgi:SAM-dependent methyltransferase
VKDNWFEKWFNEKYLVLYAHRDELDTQKQGLLITKEFSSTETGKVLDLGCGDGRYTYFLKNKGFDISGIDLSQDLINSGKKKYPLLDLQVSDMRSFKGKYRLILSLFTSFGYFSDVENIDLLKHIYNSLEIGGYFWLDYLNEITVKNNLVATAERTLENGWHVIEKKRISDNRIIKDINIFENDCEHNYTESVFLYSRKSLAQRLEKCGFLVKTCYGDYDGSPCQENSSRLILKVLKE